MKSPSVKRTIISLIFLTGTLFILQSCGGDNGGVTGPDFTTVPEPFDTTNAVDKLTYSNGLTIYVIEEGNGVFEVVESPEEQIQLFFTGRKANGEVFASSYSNGNTSPALFTNLTPVARGTNNPLIPGFRQGILGMVEGEKRTIVVPPSLGYGDTRPGTNGFDLRNDTLVYDVELDGILE